MNLWASLKKILPNNPLDVGKVIAINADGSSRIQLLGGSKITARGTGVAVGSYAYVRAGLIEGEAPSLEVVNIEV